MISRYKAAFVGQLRWALAGRSPLAGPPIEIRTADGLYFRTADGVYFGVSSNG